MDGASCACRCYDDFVGIFCQLAPAYIVSNAAQGILNGRYERLADAECGALHGKPVYQLGGESGYILFQPIAVAGWMIGPSDSATDCTAVGWIDSSENGLFGSSPSAGGCVWRWQELDAEGSTWHAAAGLAVAAQ